MHNKLFIKYNGLPVQVRASLWFLICSFLQKGISMITTPIFTRIMSTEEYGQFGVFNSWYGIATIVVGLVLYQGVHTQGLVKYDQERSIFTSSLLGLLTTLVMVWAVIYVLLRDFWNSIIKITTVQMLCIFILVWTTAVFSFWANEQRVTYSYQSLVTVTLIVSLVKPFLEIFFILHSEDKVTARSIAIVLAELLVFSWMFFYLMIRGKTFFSKKFWLYALGFNLPLVPHYLSQSVLNSADRIMIHRMVGKGEAGIYSLAYSLSLIMTIFNAALMQTISPWMFQKIKERKGKDIAPIAYITLILIATVNLILIIMAPEAVAIFAPASYYDAIWIIPPVAMSAFFMYCYDLFAKFAFYYEKTKFIMMASVVGAVLNIVLNYICIKAFGYIAAGYTTLTCYIVYSVAHYIFMKKVCDEFCDSDYPYETIKIFKIAIPFLTAGFGMLFTYRYPLLRYGIVAIMSVVAVIMRKKIVGILKDIMSVRRKQL